MQTVTEAASENQAASEIPIQRKVGTEIVRSAARCPCSAMSQVRKTQRERILQLLRVREGQWVPLPEILDLRIGQYTTRILELRRDGFAIENKTERNAETGEVHSSYRLVAEPESPKPEPAKPAEWSERRPVTGLPLWDSR